MKNKVDISKLIRQKYKETTFGISDLFESIDLVLDESDQSSFASKVVRNGVSDAIPENTSQARQISNHVNGNSVPAEPNIGAPRNQISTTINGDIPGKLNVSVPDKIAEAGEDTVQTDKQISTKVQYTLKVPDIFSMVTNTKLMQPGTADRKLINDIMANINAPTNDWLGRVRALQQYTRNLGQASAKETNISEAISSLIILNVLKKVAIFSSQSGKQFEYIFSPFLHPDAIPIGNDQVEVDDISSPTGKISLKYLTSGNPNIVVSETLLKERLAEKNKVWNEKGGRDNPPIIDYIVIRGFSTGNIQFGRLGITNNKKFAEEFYAPVSGYKGKKNVIMSIKQPSGGGVADMPAFILYMAEGGELSKSAQTGVSLKTRLTNKNFIVGGLKIPAEKVVILPEKNIEELGGIKLSDYMKRINAAVEKKDTTAIDKLLKPLPAFQNLSPGDIGGDKILEIAKTIYNQYKKDIKAFTQMQAGQKPLTTEEPPEEMLNEGLSFSIKDIWETILVETLYLGDIESYNQQQLILSNSIQKSYADVLENLDKLNTNITKYFATDQGKNEKAGEDAISNANQIVSSINSIKKEKK
jgi:hypothetical protein